MSCYQLWVTLHDSVEQLYGTYDSIADTVEALHSNGVPTSLAIAAVEATGAFEPVRFSLKSTPWLVITIKRVHYESA